MTGNCPVEIKRRFLVATLLQLDMYGPMVKWYGSSWNKSDLACHSFQIRCVGVRPLRVFSLRAWL